MTNTILLIGTNSVVTIWRNLIHSWSSWWCHGWRRCGSHLLPLLNRWRSWFNKYCAGGMIYISWLSLTINDSSVSVLIFVEDNVSLMLLTQDLCFSLGRNTLKEWVFMSHPRQVLRSSILPSPVIFLRDSGLSRFSGSYDCSGQKVYEWPVIRLFLCILSNIYCPLLW